MPYADAMRPKLLDPGSAPVGNTDFRDAARRAEEERDFERRRALESQTAADAEPADRIRIWERLHALSLPTAASHPLVAVIARQTALTLTDVRNEQQRRRTPDRSPSVVGPP